MKKIINHTFDTIYFEDGTHLWVGLTFVDKNAPIVGDFFVENPKLGHRTIVRADEAKPTPTKVKKKDTTA